MTDINIRKDIVDTQTFLDTLRRTPKAELVFELNTDAHVHPGYHVTEIMSLGYDSVDCGGVVNHWRETLVQLQAPGRHDTPKFMSAAKFLGIFDEVSHKVPLQTNAELRVEYGDEKRPALHYHVENIKEDKGRLRVVLEAPGVTCKVKDRLKKVPLAIPGINAVESCC